MGFDAIVVGVSAGGFKVLEKLITGLRNDLLNPVIIVQHIGTNAENYIVTYLNEQTPLKVKEIEEKEIIRGGTIYFAPPNYHVLVERDKRFSLTTEKRISYARPSIDILFETAAEAYLDRLLGIVLTGANSDGKNGCRAIKKWGGHVLVQDPDEAEYSEMPLSVIEDSQQDEIMSIAEMIDYINHNH
ncbi:chemotaxis protein CheB [Eubacteriaceae bacterium ES3]|nr:chemotaxis protein CheB [Eubacteriaceae bacterium ES3]